MDGTGKYLKRGNTITKEYTWDAIIDKWIFRALKLWTLKIQLAYQMIPMKKEEEGPNPGKA